MRNYAVKLWDSSCTLNVNDNSGVIGRYYVKASNIKAAIDIVLKHAKKEGYSLNRVIDVCEIEETVL